MGNLIKIEIRPTMHGEIKLHQEKSVFAGDCAPLSGNEQICSSIYHVTLIFYISSVCLDGDIYLVLSKVIKINCSPVIPALSLAF